MVMSMSNAADVARALSMGFSSKGIDKDQGSLQTAIEHQLGTDLVGQAFATQGNTIGQMSATSAPDWLLITSPMIFRYVMMSVDALTAALFRLVRFSRIAPNQRLLTLKQVIYNADTWNAGIEYVPGTTQTQTSQSIQVSELCDSKESFLVTNITDLSLSHRPTPSSLSRVSAWI